MIPATVRRHLSLRPFPLSRVMPVSPLKLSPRREGTEQDHLDCRPPGPRCRTPAPWFSRRWWATRLLLLGPPAHRLPGRLGGGADMVLPGPGARIRRGERVSTMLLLGTALLTARTAISFITGSALLYFAQPMATAVVVAVVLIGSAALGRPLTQRFVHDFCPIDPELLARPRVRQFFVRISMLWATVLMVNAGVTLWLLLSSHSARSSSNGRQPPGGSRLCPYSCPSRGSWLPCARTASRSSGAVTTSRGPLPSRSPDPTRASYSWSGSPRLLPRPGGLVGHHGVPASQSRPSLRAVRPRRTGCVPGPHLDAGGHPPAAMGGRSPQAPRVHRHTSRPHLTSRPRFHSGLVRQRPLVPEGSPRPRHHGQIRPGPARGPVGSCALQSRCPRPRLGGRSAGAALRVATGAHRR